MYNTNRVSKSLNRSVSVSGAPQLTFINYTMPNQNFRTQGAPQSSSVNDRQPLAQRQTTTQGHDVPQVPKEIIEISDDENEDENEPEMREPQPTVSQPSPAPVQAPAPTPKPARKSMANMAWYRAGCSATNTTMNRALFGVDNKIACNSLDQQKQMSEWSLNKEAKIPLQKEAEKAVMETQSTPKPAAPQPKVKKAPKQPSERTKKRKFDENVYGQREVENQAKRQRKTANASANEDTVWMAPLTLEQIEATRSLETAKNASAVPALVAAPTPAKVQVPMLPSPVPVAVATRAAAPAVVPAPALPPPVLVPALPVQAPVAKEQEVEQQPTVVAATNDGLDDLFEDDDGEDWPTPEAEVEQQSTVAMTTDDGLDYLFDDDDGEDWPAPEVEVERQPTVTKIQKRGLGDSFDQMVAKEDAVRGPLVEQAVDLETSLLDVMMEDDHDGKEHKKDPVDMQTKLENMSAEMEDEDEDDDLFGDLEEGIEGKEAQEDAGDNDSGVEMTFDDEESEESEEE